MKRTLLAISTFSFLVSCLSINPYNEPEGKGAYLKNRIEYKGKARYSYFFVSAGKKGFSPGLITPEGEAVYKIPSGKMGLRLKIVYTPKARSGISLEDQYEIWVLKINLKSLEGYTYQINCKIENGKAYVWIEEVSGKKVSETVFGLKADYPYYLVWRTLPQPVP